MFSNVSKKIKILAQIVLWLGIIVSVVIGCFMMATDEDLIASGFLVWLFGVSSSFIYSFALYGIGQLIENTDDISRKLQK